MQLLYFIATRRTRHNGAFLLGACGFLSLLSCSVKFTVSLKAPGDISWPCWLLLSMVNLGSSACPWTAVVLVASPFAASAVASGEPNRETTCKDLPMQGGTEGRTVAGGVRLSQFGGTGVNVGDGTCPLSCAGAAAALCPMGLQPCLCFLTLYERTSSITKDYFYHTSLFPPPRPFFVSD